MTLPRATPTGGSCVTPIAPRCGRPVLFRLHTFARITHPITPQEIHSSGYLTASPHPVLPTPHPDPSSPTHTHHLSKTPNPAALVALFKGRVAELLRHPQGADVLTDLYDVAPQPLRNAMCAELYGREYVLFEGVGGGAPLAEKVRAVV